MMAALGEEKVQRTAANPRSDEDTCVGNAVLSSRPLVRQRQEAKVTQARQGERIHKLKDDRLRRVRDEEVCKGEDLWR